MGAIGDVRIHAMMKLDKAVECQAYGFHQPCGLETGSGPEWRRSWSSMRKLFAGSGNSD